MASIRRTLSPWNDRPYQNGGGLFSGQSSPHKFLSSGKCSSMLSTFVVGVRKFFGGIFLAKHSRKNQNHSQWKRSFCRCLLLFFVGFLFGMTPFGSFEDLRSHDFAFEIKPPPVNVQKDPENAVISRPENFIVNKVQLAVDSELNVKGRFDYRPRKQLIVVTPTYNRALQAYYLHRLGQVLSLVQPPLLWIVVEMKSASVETAEILRNTRVMYRHLVCNKNLTNIKDRGVHQRNTALDHIELHKLDGIVYFADDDNIYSIELFESMREISHFGTWPVAMLTQSKNKAILEGPVCNGSQVIGWHTNEKSKRLRRFHVDMSGFAFNSTILWNLRLHQRISNPIRQLSTVKEGFQETTFIEQMVKDESQMEGIPTNCSKILNWHLHLEVSDLVYPRGWLLPKKLDILPTR